MNSHLVTVEIGVESLTYEGVELDSVTFDKTRVEGLYTEAVKRRRTVQEHVLALDAFFENRPYFWDAVFDKLVSAANVERELSFEELRDDERLEKLERHMLWKTAFVKRE
jgi:hypothetical protein